MADVSRDQLYQALRNADAAGDEEGARKLATYIQSLPADTAPAATSPAAAPSITDRIGGAVTSLGRYARLLTPVGIADALMTPEGRADVANNAAGGLRGAGSIGATLLYPFDKGMDLANGDIKPGAPSRNEQRRAAMDDALVGVGADTSSGAYRTGKLSAEVAGTAGAGGAVANVASKIPGVASVAPNLLTAIRTAGMSAGDSSGLANPIIRAAGGAINGGVSAGLIDPKEAKTGAFVGAVLPGAAQAVGMAANKLGTLIRGLVEQSPDLAASIDEARRAGYVIPPAQANSSFLNRTLEGFSGKLSTAQNASAKNQAITNAKAATALGLPSETKITPEVLGQVRADAGKAYEAIGATGTITPGPGYTEALDKIAAPYAKAAAGFPDAKPSPVLELVDSLKSPAFDAESAVQKIKQLRTAADDAFRSGNTDVARASKAAAGALEDALESHLQQIDQPDLLSQFRDARAQIAKTYSVQNALNPATGTVDARKLATQLAKGKPLSGDLKDAAAFAARFPKAAQPVETMGSLPQTSPLDWAMGGGMSLAAHNPLALLGVAARPAARALALSPLVQNRLVQSPNALQALLSANPGLAQLAYRAAPALAVDR